jgi:hypothetical protein
LTTSFKNLVNQNAVQDTGGRDTTVVLREANQSINDGVRALRLYIKGENIGVNDLDSEYVSYGLEVVNAKGLYGLGVDNDRRMNRINLIIKKLNTAGNPFKTRKYGLVFWQNLKTVHTAAWDLSKNNRSGKSAASNQTIVMQKEIKETLKKMQMQLKIDFPKDDLPAVMRTFGFLKEIYR